MSDYTLDDDALMRAVRAHDREEAAQKGEPDPWTDGFPEPYRTERLTAMRCAFKAATLRQQGGVCSVADDVVTAAARVLCAYESRECNVDKDDNWNLYAEDFKAQARPVVEAVAPLLQARAITAALAQNTQGDAVAYFAADPAEGDFSIHDTLEAARADAEKILGYAQDAASEDGWADEPPQICYGIVLGKCIEKEGSRRPAPEGSEYNELVDYRLTAPVHAERATVPDALYVWANADTPTAGDPMYEAARAHVREMLKAAPSQPKDLPPENCRQRLWKDGKAYPRSGCAVCGKWSPRSKECDAALATTQPKDADQ